jgi:hypothetical protein
MKTARLVPVSCLSLTLLAAIVTSKRANGDTISIKLNGATPPTDYYEYVNQDSSLPSVIIKRPNAVPYFVYSDAGGTPGNIGYIRATLQQGFGGNVTVRVQTTLSAAGAHDVGEINLTDLKSGTAWSQVSNSTITGTLGTLWLTKVGASGGFADFTGGIGKLSGPVSTLGGGVQMTFNGTDRSVNGTINCGSLTMSNVTNWAANTTCTSLSSTAIGGSLSGNITVNGNCSSNITVSNKRGRDSF